MISIFWPLIIAIFLQLNWATESTDRRCFPILYDSTNLTLPRDGLGNIPPDIIVNQPAAGFIPHSTPILGDIHPTEIHSETSNFVIRRFKRRALDLKTKEMKERPSCRKNAGAYGQETPGMGMKVATKVTNTQVDECTIIDSYQCQQCLRAFPIHPTVPPLFA